MTSTLDLDTLELAHGAHRSREQGVCAMEAVAWLAGLPHSDAPACTSPVLRSFLIRCNDRWGHEDRQQLKPFLPRVIGTRDDGKDDARRRIAAEYVFQNRLPARSFNVRKLLRETVQRELFES